MKYERLKDEVAGELKTLIRFNSVSNRSNSEIVDYLEKFYAEKGHEALRFSSKDKNGAEKVNLAVFVGKPPYSKIFSIHTDTVPPGDLALWKETGCDPWNPAEKDGKVFGLGASDTKGSIAVLNTLVKNRIFNPEKGFIAVFTYDEEVGLIGARRLLSEWKPPETVRYAVACEPTDNLVVTGQKGFAAFDLEIMPRDRIALAGLTRSVKMKFNGREAHASRPHQGRNAADVACGYFDSVGDCADAMICEVSGGTARNKVMGELTIFMLAGAGIVEKFASIKDDSIEIERVDLIGESYGKGGGAVSLASFHKFLRSVREIALFNGSAEDSFFAPSKPTLNIGMIHGAGERLKFLLDLRVIPPLDAADLARRVLSAAKECGFSGRLDFPHDPIPPVKTELDENEKEKLSGILSDTGKSAYTEAALYFRLGLKALIAGPGNLLVHRPDEYITVDALVKGIEIYERLAFL